MELILIYGAAFAAAAALFFGLRWAAARFGGANLGIGEHSRSPKSTTNFDRAYHEVSASVV